MKNVRNALVELAKGNAKYAQFNKNIVNTKKRVLGARTPDLRKLAKSLAKDLDFNGTLNFLKNCDKNVYEEVLLAGFIINYAKFTDAQKMKLTRLYLKHADSWALVDCFVSTRIKFDKEKWFNFAAGYLNSKEEFEARFGIIFLMAGYLEKDYIDRVFLALKKVKSGGYYVKMGLAWLFATAAVKFYEKTLKELEANVKNGVIDVWTYNNSLQKMTESYRFTNAQKQEIRALKQK
ncbi:MAG: DNA alkylation repair protein [Endomicrobium sp.]|jgi:3-methyladenine DNA glycosylase AlkD|nr:DNA alkylation repair protein [Endomicrobium sp.]